MECLLLHYVRMRRQQQLYPTHPLELNHFNKRGPSPVSRGILFYLGLARSVGRFCFPSLALQAQGIPWRTCETRKRERERILRIDSEKKEESRGYTVCAAFLCKTGWMQRVRNIMMTTTMQLKYKSCIHTMLHPLVMMVRSFLCCSIRIPCFG